MTIKLQTMSKIQEEFADKINQTRIRNIMVADWGMKGTCSYEAARAVKSYVLKQVAEELKAKEEEIARLKGLVIEFGIYEYAFEKGWNRHGGGKEEYFYRSKIDTQWPPDETIEKEELVKEFKTAYNL